MSKPVNKAANFSNTLAAQFRAVTIGDDYNYSYTSFVFVNSAAPIEEGINIKKGEEVPLFKDSSETLEYCKTPIDIDVITKNNLKDADLVVADLLKSIGLNKNLSGNAMNTIHITTLSNVPDQQGNLIAHRRIQIEIYFRRTCFGI